MLPLTRHWPGAGVGEGAGASAPAAGSVAAAAAAAGTSPPPPPPTALLAARCARRQAAGSSNAPAQMPRAAACASSSCGGGRSRRWAPPSAEAPSARPASPPPCAPRPREHAQLRPVAAACALTPLQRQGRRPPPHRRPPRTPPPAKTEWQAQGQVERHIASAPAARSRCRSGDRPPPGPAPPSRRSDPPPPVRRPWGPGCTRPQSGRTCGRGGGRGGRSAGHATAPVLCRGPCCKSRFGSQPPGRVPSAHMSLPLSWQATGRPPILACSAALAAWPHAYSRPSAAVQSCLVSGASMPNLRTDVFGGWTRRQMGVPTLRSSAAAHMRMRCCATTSVSPSTTRAGP